MSHIKHSVIVAVLALLLPFGAGAQTYADEFRQFQRNYRELHRDDPVQIVARLGISGTPLAASEYFSSERYVYSAYTLSNVYGDYYGPAYTYGTLVGGVDVLFSSGMSVGIDLGLNVISRAEYNGRTDRQTGTERGVALYMMPVFKYYWLTRPMVRIYQSAGVGVGKYIGYSSLTYRIGDSYYDRSFKVEAQYVPFGLEMGKRFFGFAELGVGTMYMGARAGIGYIF